VCRPERPDARDVTGQSRIVPILVPLRLLWRSVPMLSYRLLILPQLSCAHIHLASYQLQRKYPLAIDFPYASFDLLNASDFLDPLIREKPEFQNMKVVTMQMDMF
jgi:hypothetical protein